MKNAKTLVRGVAVSTTLLVSIVACNFLIDTDAEQCTTTADCEARFPNSGRVCQLSSCVKVDVQTDAASEAGPECTSNAECIDRLGKPAMCVQGKCQTISSDSLCLPQLLPLGLKDGKTGNDLLRNDNAIVVGALVEVPAAAVLQQPSTRAYNIALKEIDETGGPTIGPDGSPRPVVMAVCRAETALVDKSVDHLVKDLAVPAVVPLFDSTSILEKITRLAAAGVFAVNPNPPTLDLKYSSAVRGMAWHLLGTDEDLALTYRPVIAKVEEYVRVRRSLDSSTKVKIALISTNYPGDTSIANTLREGPSSPIGSDAGPRDPKGAITFNGNESPTTSSNFLEVLPRLSQTNTDITQDVVNQLVTTITNFGPDIIIAVTGTGLAKIVEPIDKALDPKRPVWVLSTGNAHVPEVLTYLDNDETIGTPESHVEKRARFLGVQYAGSNDPQRAAWLRRMELEYGRDAGANNDYSASENFYDAIYWIAYGFQAASPPQPPITGASLKIGIGRLLSGTEVYPGDPDVVRKNFHQINVERANSGTLRYVGALGPRDIDPISGTIFGTGALYCYDEDSVSRRTTVKYDVLRYSAANGGSLVAAGSDPATCYLNFP
jgi:hypothetical protein